MSRHIILLLAAVALTGFAVLHATEMSLLWTITASYPEYWAEFGYAADAVGDLNNDGALEFAVSARNENPSPPPTNYGRVYIFDGATGLRLTALSPIPEPDGGRMGHSVAGVGDTNGDGIGDILAGAPYEDLGDTNSAGAAYLFSGADFSQLRRIQSPAACSNGLFGYDVSGIEDVTGDGLVDLIIGASYESSEEGPPRSGHVHILNGATGGFVRTLELPVETENGFFGTTVAGSSDLNNDGVSDLLVGAPGDTVDGTNRLGVVYVFSGADWSVIRTVHSPALDTYGRFGSSLATTADIDGDLVADFMVGAPGEDDAGMIDIGRVYVFSGASGLILFTLETPYPEDVSFDFGEFGTEVADAGDIDGDGTPDLLVGAEHEDPEGSPKDAGRAYIFSGVDGRLLYIAVSPDEGYEGYFGCSVVGIGDVFGDARAEIVIGAYHEDPWPAPSDVNGGKAHLFTPPIVLSGNLVGSNLVLEWTADPRAEQYLINGGELPYFNLTPASQIDIVLGGILEWSTSLGLGQPEENWTFLVLGTDASDDTVSVSNRFGEHDFATAIP